MKLSEMAWDSEMVYPVLFMPKKCASISQNLKLTDDVFIFLSIRSFDLDHKENIFYSGYCNIKLVEKCEIHVQDVQATRTPENKSRYNVELPTEISSQDEYFYPYSQSQVWIDPLRSPFIYNNYKTNGPQGNISICHQSQSNRITLNQHNTYITQNVYNYSEPLYELDSSKNKKIAYNNDMAQHTSLTDTELNSLYENDDFEYEILMSQLPQEINENMIDDTIEVDQVELQTENDALEQLISSGIQTPSKQQETILFLGNESACEPTVEKIAVNDPSVEYMETQAQHDVTIDDLEKMDSSTQKKYQCEKCKQIFDQLATFKQHMVDYQNKAAQAVTEGEDNLFCSLCNKKMKTREKYEIHCAGHGNPDLECDKCFKVFASKSSLRTHRKLHMRKYPCDLCTKSFSKQVELKAHFGKAHSMHKCDSCNYMTYDQKQLQTHQNSHMDCAESDDQLLSVIYKNTENNKIAQNNEKEEYKTTKVQKRPKKDITQKEADANEIIAKIISSKIFLLNSKAARKEKGFKKSCDVCDKSFDRIGDLKRHLIEHIVSNTLLKNPVDKNGTLYIECEVCREANFTKTDKYKEHLREHAKLTLYQCSICYKSFSDSSNFSKHKKIHGSTFLQCDLCQRKFNSKKMLTQHIDYHNKNSPLECSYCDKVFYFKSMLNKHIKCMHVKESSTRFRCRFCHQYYKSLKEKWDHEWYIHKVRKVVADCFACDAKFRKYAELKRHCNAFHNLDIPSAKKLEELNREI